jgi:hypothetical protein
LRPVDLEVVELLRVDRGDLASLPELFEMFHSGGGRVGRVVPAFEGGDRYGLVQGGKPSNSVTPPAYDVFL